MSFIDIFSRFGMRGHLKVADIRLAFDHTGDLKIDTTIERFDAQGTRAEPTIPDEDFGFWMSIGQFMVYWFGIIRYTGCHDARFTRVASITGNLKEAVGMVNINSLLESHPVISFAFNKQTKRAWVFLQGVPSVRIYVHSFICFRLVMEHLEEVRPGSKALIEEAITWMERGFASMHPVENFDTDPSAADMAATAMLERILASVT
jgi:hypothetical protein